MKNSNNIQIGDKVNVKFKNGDEICRVTHISKLADLSNKDGWDVQVWKASDQTEPVVRNEILDI